MTTDNAAAMTPRLLLRAEGLALLIAMLVAWRIIGGTWSTFALWFFVPDLSLLGYFAGPTLGARLYNSAHTLIGPTLLAAAALLHPTPHALEAALIWSAHIGFDRAAGYGLKHAGSFRETHLGRVGRV